MGCLARNDWWYPGASRDSFWRWYPPASTRSLDRVPFTIFWLSDVVCLHQNAEIVPLIILFSLMVNKDASHRTNLDAVHKNQDNFLFLMLKTHPLYQCFVIYYVFLQGLAFSLQILILLNESCLWGYCP